MKKVITVIFIVAAIGCNKNSSTKNLTPAPAQTLVAAFFIRPEGGYDVDAVYRVIQKSVKYDSSAKRDVITTDTGWFYPKFVPMLDSLKNQVKDSAGKGQLVRAYFPISKDSVWWDISGRDLDSLIRTVSQQVKK